MGGIFMIRKNGYFVSEPGIDFLDTESKIPEGYVTVEDLAAQGFSYEEIKKMITEAE